MKEPTLWKTESQAYIIDPDFQLIIAYNAFRGAYCAAWLGVMVTLGLAYYLLTFENKRKSKLFRLQFSGILMAILHCCSEIAMQIYQFNGTLSEDAAKLDYTFFESWLTIAHWSDHFIPLFSDSLLLFRISAFYPYPVYSKRIRLLIFSPFVFLLVIRFLLSILVGLCLAFQLLIFDQPYWSYVLYDYVSAMENALGAFYCFLGSIILIRKAYKLSKARSTNSRYIYRRMKFFSEALTMTFVFPIFINIALGIQLVWHWPHYVYFRETQMLNVNLTVFSSIMATSWSSIRETLTKEELQTRASNEAAKKERTE